MLSHLMNISEFVGRLSLWIHFVNSGLEKINQSQEYRRYMDAIGLSGTYYI